MVNRQGRGSRSGPRDQTGRDLGVDLAPDLLHYERRPAEREGACGARRKSLGGEMNRRPISRFTRSMAAASFIAGVIVAGAGTASATAGPQATFYVSNAPGHEGYGGQ